MSKIIVTGAAGFIASHTINLLENHGHSVMGVDNLRTGNMANLVGFRGIFHLCDIRDIKLLEQSFSEFKPDAVIHLAAQSAISTAMKEPRTDMEINVIGTLNLLELSKKYKVQRFVFSSTSAVYTETKSPWGGMREDFSKEPQSPYGISKLAAEGYVRNLFPNHVIFRYGNIYGPRQIPIGENQVIPQIIRHFLFGDDFKLLYNGNQKRDFVYVEDVANANVSALDTGEGTYNLATGKSHSVNEVLREIEKYFGVLGYEWDRTNKPDPRGDVHINVSKAVRELVCYFGDTSLPAGIAKTIKWWEEQKGKI
jgi:UDP-glucose 4-epimerase